jgi:phosphatidylglycerol:prolipoprotein diacylglycerol transferase
MTLLASIHSFSLLLAIGASFSLWRLALASPAAQRFYWLLTGLLTLLGALLGARIFYILEHLHYYALYAKEIVQIWQGGLAWEGALAGALLSILLAARVWQWDFWQLCDRLMVMLLPLSLATWLACLLEGSAYGIALPQDTWWGIRVLDETGIAALRSPVQPLAALSLLVFLGLAEVLLRKSTRPGLRSSVLLLIFSLDMLLFTFMRADAAQSWLGLRLESWAALVYTFAALLSTIRFLNWFKRLPSLRWFKKRTISESKAL